MADDAKRFYDQIAAEYDLLFADWHASMKRQAESLDRIIQDTLGQGTHHILDVACGIGTQAIGLALLGHSVQARDLSPRSVERAEREARAIGAVVTFRVADMRDLSGPTPGPCDAVIACDNALPHLLHDDDLHLAVSAMAGMLREGGLFLASTRDYDRLAEERPRYEAPRVFADPAARISFQVWDWSPGGDHYQLTQFILQRDGTTWRTAHFTTPYRALRRAEMEAAIAAAGLVDARWHEPEETGFFQPIVTARSP